MPETLENEGMKCREALRRKLLALKRSISEILNKFQWGDKNE